MNRKTIQYEGRNILGTYPFLFPLLRLRFGDFVISKRTDICIEGPPRSANSFAVNVFHLQNPQCLIAHHVHVPMQVIYAVNHHIPCIVLLREPSEVLSSLLIVDRNLSVESAIRSYIYFYQRIRPVRSSVIVASFEQVITDFSGIMLRVNAKYGSTFNHSPLSKEEVDDIFSKMEEKVIRNKMPRLLVPVPTDEKNFLKLDVKEVLHKTPMFRDAQSIYEEWCSYQPA
jgi:hypothetical protein